MKKGMLLSLQIVDADTLQGRNYDRFGACMPLVEQTAGYTTVYTTMMNKPIYWVMVSPFRHFYTHSGTVTNLHKLNLTDPVQKSSTGQSSHQTKIVAAQELAFPDDLKTILSKIKAMCAMLVGSGDVDDAEMEKHKDEVLALCSKYLEDLREDYEWEKVDGSLSDDWVEAECFSMRNG